MNTALFREYTRYVTLQVLGMLGLSVYILADTFFIARWLGAGGLAALNIALPIFSIINGLALMLGMGGGARFMLRKSCGEYGEACQVFTRTVRIAAGFAGLIMLLGLVRAREIASFLGADAEIIGMTTVYLRTVMLCAPLFTANHVLLSFLRNDGAPKLAMTAMLTGSFANIILDWLMIYVLRWGMFGAAFATCLSPVISIGVTLPHLLQGKNTFHLYRTEFSSRQCSFIMTTGGSALIAELSNGVVIFVFNMLMQRFAGNCGVAAYGIIANIALVVVSVFTGVSQGMQPLVSRSHGKGKTASARRILWFGIGTVAVLFVLLYAGIVLLADPITSVFNSENDPVLQELAVRGMRLYFIGALGAGLNIVTAVYLSCREHVVPANVLSLLRGLFVIVPAAVVLAVVFHVTGVWLAFPVTEGLCAVGSVACILYFRQKDKDAEW